MTMSGFRGKKREPSSKKMMLPCGKLFDIYRLLLDDDTRQPLALFD